MTYRTVKLEGTEAIQDDVEPTHFYPLEDGLAVFEKSNVGIVPVEGYFQNSFQPLESNNIDWRNVRFKVKTKADTATTDFNIVCQLWGGLPDGTEQLISEWIKPTISTTETEDEVLYDLNNSSSLPELAHQDVAGATSGKAYLNLPLRWKNYDTVELRPCWAEGYTYCKYIWLQGSNVAPKVGQNILVEVPVTYASGMKSDFSDIRFVDSNGKTYLCHERVSYTASTSAIFRVYIPNIPGHPEITPLLMFYGNSSAGTASNPFAIQFYDDFEDGKWTGRDDPYTNWLSPNNRLTIESGSPINGAYSLKYSGASNPAVDHSYLEVNSGYGNNYVVECDFRLLTQGTGTSAPWIRFLRAVQDSTNYLDFESYWYPTSSRQRIRIKEVVEGVSTTIAEVDWLTSKLSTTKYTLRFTNTGSSVKFEVNGVSKASGSYSPSISPTRLGITSQYNETYLIDNVRISPYKAQIPTILSTSSAFTYSPISPDGTPGDEDQTLTFTRPWGNYPVPCYVYVDELGVEGVKTNNSTIHNKGRYRLGADGIDKYVSLKNKVFVTGDDQCNIEFSDFQYEYEVFE